MTKRTSLLVLALAGTLLLVLLPATATGTACNTAWSSTTAYNGGATVSYAGVNYTANWWTQGNEPDKNNGGPGTGQPWTSNGACGGGATATATGTATKTATATATATATKTATATATATKTATATATATGTGGPCNAAWVSTTAYNGGATVSYNGVNYTAAYWSQGSTPSTNSGPAGSGAPWITGGSCSGGGGTATPTSTAIGTATKTATPCQSNCSASGFILAPYKDVTVGANWNTGAQQTNGMPVTQAMPNQTLVWSFATGTCGSENWAGISVPLEASNVAAFVSAGKHYIIGTGGAAGSFDCPSSSGLVSFIQHYYSSNMVGVDFDIETGQSSGVISNLVNSAKGAESSYPGLRFSFTLASFGSTAANPVLNATGVAVVNQIKSSGLGGNYTVNPMAFDFGAANPTYCVVVNGTCEMGQSAIAAMEAVNSQFGIPYGHIEVTLEVPTDDGGTSFTMADVSTVCSWIRSNGVAGIRYWSLDRDGGTYARAIMSACGTN